MRIAGAVAALLALFPAAAGAQLRAVAPASAPALFGDRVLWGSRSGDVFSVVSAPVAGGPAVPFGSVPIGPRDAVELAATPGQVAVQLRDSLSTSARGRLFAAGADGVFGALASNVGAEPISERAEPMQVTAAGVLTLESVPRLRDGTGVSEVALPPYGDPELIAAAGTVAVAPTGEGTLVVFDLLTGTEQRQIALGRFDPATLNGLAISPSGDVAATVPVGDGSDVVLFAPADAVRVRVLATGAEFSRVAVAGGRVAYIGAVPGRDGVRVTVLDASSGRVVWRGPAASDIGGLGFDGRALAFHTPSCGYAGVLGTSQAVLPPGPCVRTEIAVSTTIPAVRSNRLRVRIGCINAPLGRCRVTATLRTRGGKLAGRVGGRVAVADTRVLAIPLRPVGRRVALRDDGARLVLTVVVTDPDGRSRVVSSV